MPLTDDDLFEATELAAAMKEWAIENGKGAGLLLLEGARTIEKLVAELKPTK